MNAIVAHTCGGPYGRECPNGIIAGTMEIRSLAELIAPDERTLLFGPFGLGAPLTADQATKMQQAAIAGADLLDDVPEPVTLSFERLRSLHSYGVLFYDAYTVVTELRWVVLEMALRERFVSFYASAIPIVNRAGTATTFPAANFDTISEAFRRGGSHARCQLVPRPGGTPVSMPLTLAPLLSWARAQQLLEGQRNRLLEQRVFRPARNHFAHGAGHQLTMPNQSAAAIRDLAEIINRLWGTLTAGGRLYPAPLKREVLVIGWSDGDVDDRADRSLVTMRASHIRDQRDQYGDDWRYIVVLGIWDDAELMEFDTRYELTHYPTDLLWGPGNHRECAAWLANTNPTGDEVSCLDRLFLVQTRDGQARPPRLPEVMLALNGEERDGDWLLIRADSPFDAFHHARHTAAGESCSGEDRCPVEELARGSWGDVAAVTNLELASAQPRRPQPIMVPRQRPFP